MGEVGREFTSDLIGEIDFDRVGERDDDVLGEAQGLPPLAPLLLPLRDSILFNVAAVNFGVGD